MDLISMYRGALVDGFVNILVYFDKLANTFETPRSIFIYKKLRFWRLRLWNPRQEIPFLA